MREIMSAYAMSTSTAAELTTEKEFNTCGAHREGIPSLRARRISPCKSKHAGLRRVHVEEPRCEELPGIVALRLAQPGWVEGRSFLTSENISGLSLFSGDWLQGPYVYFLYSQYGFDKDDIGKLFIAGFGSSMLFGTIVGSLADKTGRKRACITYCITYILSCVTKHSPQYKVLMIGRILGGIATSLLFSSFESWLVAEHFKRGYEVQWLSLTFSKAIFLGNGLVAIVAGLVANTLAKTLGFGHISPFNAAACALAVGMAIILSTWRKNYGDPSESKHLVTQFKGAATAIASDEKIALLGAIQSLFEGSTYTFVFLWTLALSPNEQDIPHGFMFATFMLASMMGSSLASRLMACPTPKVEGYMQIVFMVSTGTFLLPIITTPCMEPQQ